MHDIEQQPPRSWPPVWGARWIWGDAPDVDGTRAMGVLTVPREAWNRWFYLRRALHLDAVPASVPCRVTADSRYVLHVNGQEVGRGPARSVPERLTWAELDLAPYLHPGDNAVAALVRFYGRAMAWWRPVRPSFQLGYGGLLLEAPAVDLHTDASWKTLAGPYQANVMSDGFYPITEVVDGAGVPDGWTSAGFDDSGWSPAVELMGEFLSDERLRPPTNPYPSMEPDGIAPLTADEQTLRSIGQAADGDDTRLTWDAERIVLATPWVEARGEAGTVVELAAGEDIAADGTVVTKPRDYALVYKLKGTGDTERIDAFEAVGFRYLSATVRGPGEITAAGAIERRYPRVGDASFTSDDEHLDRIWRVGARTLDVCSTDAFLDCPGREQRAWVGDAYVHGLLTYVTNADWRLARRNLVLCAQSHRPDGLLSMSATGDLSTAAMTIPDYSLHWIRALVRYYEHTGDAVTVRRLVPTALQVADTFERWRDPDGLLHGVPGWVFVDWAQTERAEVIGAINALHAAALDELAGLVLALGGDAEQAAILLDGALRTREGFDLLWDPARGAYVDAADGGGRRTRVSQQTNAAAILGGCAPPARWAGMLDHVLDPARLVITATPADLQDGTGLLGQWFDPATFTKFDETTDVVQAQPFFSHFVHQAVVKAGRRDLVVDLCRRWWAQLERGNTTIEEYWDAPPGGSSRAHAWAATPTYDLTTHVLGIRPLEAGYTRAAVRPCFGDLGRVAGRVPTPHGWIDADLTPAGGTLSVPDGIVALVELPGAPALECGPGRHALRATG